MRRLLSINPKSAAATLVAAALFLLSGLSCGDPGPEGEASAAASRGVSTPKQADARELVALGYADWDPVDEESAQMTAPGRGGLGTGVLRHNADGAHPSRRVWTDDRSLVLSCRPDGSELRRIEVPGHTQVELARPLRGGRILALSVDEGLTLLEPDGSVVWQTELACHHEATVAPRPGDAIGTRLFAVAVHHERAFQGRRVRFDSVTFIEEATGSVTRDPAWPGWSTWEHRDTLSRHCGDAAHPLATPPPAARDEAAAPATVYDYFHLNGIAFGGPDIMHVCLRNVSLVAQVQVATGIVQGGTGPGQLDWPHAPSIIKLESGKERLLVFDNGTHRGWSRVVEIDLTSTEITWSWSGAPHDPLWSRVRGFVERLPNGNTLVTESERGHVVEVTRSGAVVWEFLNPEMAKTSTGPMRRRIYRMHASPGG